MINERSSLATTVGAKPTNAAMHSFIIVLNRHYGFPADVKWQHARPDNIQEKFDNVDPDHQERFNAFLIKKVEGKDTDFVAFDWNLQDEALRLFYPNYDATLPDSRVKYKTDLWPDTIREAMSEVQNYFIQSGYTDIYFVTSNELYTVQQKRMDARIDDKAVKLYNQRKACIMYSLQKFQRFQQDYNRQIRQALDQNLYGQVEHLSKGLKNLNEIIQIIGVIKDYNTATGLPLTAQRFFMMLAYEKNLNTSADRIKAAKLFVHRLALTNFDVDQAWSDQW